MRFERLAIRYVRFKALMKYKREVDIQRQAALDEWTAYDQQAGLGPHLRHFAMPQCRTPRLRPGARSANGIEHRASSIVDRRTGSWYYIS